MILIKKILLLLLLIFLIHYLSEGQLINKINNYFNNCKNTIENFIDIANMNLFKPAAPDIPFQLQKDFQYNNQSDLNNLDEDTYNLYKFLNSIITIGVNTYELTPSNNIRLKVSDDFKKEIYDQLNKQFNCNCLGYKFNNIKILSDMYFYENARGGEIEPFELSADVVFNNSPIGSVVIYIECFMKKDKFYYNSTNSGYLAILNIKLIKRIYSDGKSREQVWNSAYKLIPSNQDTTPIQQIRVESFTNNYTNENEIFIKSDNQYQNDTEDSLIPSNIELSPIS
jgi:hypothetical protein